MPFDESFIRAFGIFGTIGFALMFLSKLREDS